MANIKIKDYLKNFGIIFWLFFIPLLLVDLVIKRYLYIYFLLKGIDFVEIFSFLNLYVVFNYGFSFSLMSFLPSVFNVIVSLIALIIFVFFILYSSLRVQLKQLILALVLAGGVGNIIDRVQFGGVIDYLDFHIGTWHFATFNLADILINFSAILVITTSLRKGKLL